MKPLLVSIAVSTLTLAAASAADRGEDIGQAGAVTPSAIAALDDERRQLARDVNVRFGEVLSTSRRGNAGIVFEDQTRLFVAENSEIEIDEYVFAASNRIDLRLVKGVIRLASGRVGGRNISVRTPVAQLGFRGTVASISTEATRTVLYVEDGAVEATVGQQIITVNEGQSLTIEQTGAGSVVDGWPADLNAAITALSSQLATVAPVALAVPAEVVGKVTAQDVDAAASSTPPSDDGFSYD